jgi:hypothetical protein
MSSVRNWAARSVIAAAVLLSPVLAFLMVIAVEMLIDLLGEEVGPLTLLDLVAAGAVVWMGPGPHHFALTYSCPDNVMALLG